MKVFMEDEPRPNVAELRAVLAADVAGCLAKCQPTFQRCVDDPSKSDPAAFKRCAAEFASCSSKHCDKQ